MYITYLNKSNVKDPKKFKNKMDLDSSFIPLRYKQYLNLPNPW